MDIHDLSSFKEDLKVVKSLLLGLVSKRDLLLVRGLGSVAHWPEFEKASAALLRIEPQLAQLQSLSKFLNASLSNRITEIYSSSSLLSGAAEISIAIEISNLTTPSSSIVGAILSPFINAISKIIGYPVYKEQFSSTGSIPLNKMLVEIERLIPIVDELDSIAWTRHFDDDEVFKPSEINIENVHVFVQDALLQISSSSDLEKDTKDKLEEYLNAVSTELSKKAPAWKNIVGSLVIVSAILGGLAAAPDALENVQSAVKYILGTSIEEIIPSKKTNPNLLPKAFET